MRVKVRVKVGSEGKGYCGKAGSGRRQKGGRNGGRNEEISELGG